MSEHDSISGMLSLASAGVLSPEEERRVQNHLTECPDCRRELAIWKMVAGEVRRPEPCRVPSGLLERTREVLVASEGAREERRWSDAILAFLVLFTWTMGAVTWLAVRLVTDGPSGVASASLGGSLLWIGGSTLLAWLTAGIAAAVLTLRSRLVRSL